MLCTVTLLLRRRSSKLGLTSFNVIARRFLMSHDTPGVPKSATTKNNVKEIHDLVLANRRLEVREIAETVRISKDCVGHILHEILGMRKLSARRVPRFSLRTTSAKVRPLQSSV